MDEQHLLHDLMKAVAEEKAEFTTRPYFPGMEKFAAFAYVAERFGYRYMGHVPGTASMNNPYYLFQRTPDARERANSILAGQNGAYHGGSLPGMRPGRGLHPTPEAQAEVDLLYSRMMVDASDRFGPRVLKSVIGIPFVMAIALAFPGYTMKRVLIAFVIWLALLVFYITGRAVGRRRREKHMKRLAGAGVEWPPNKDGNPYLLPGRDG
ncbi:hypothetical protein [Streptomyces sp. TRM68416]|uniref:hypothetical protein n=1 Tax=Streptomyces sp. TRM68416 TaxID=2758412 RepID=UPI0016618A37|nr:hypothetical protein [Streptomyces sp. TRM68416]MBD0842757.1 hypothetical protein [Streptomyces sp. TRM68416]